MFFKLKMSTSSQYLALLSFGFMATSFSASAQSATTAASNAADPMKGILLNLPIFIGIFALFYFGMIRPQKQQQKQQSEFIASLKRGDEVITSSGIIGTIQGLTDKVVTLEIGGGTEIRVVRSQISSQFK